LSLCSPWQWFCSTRTLSNCVETTISTVAIYHWPWHWPGTARDSKTVDKDQSQVAEQPLGSLPAYVVFENFALHCCATLGSCHVGYVCHWCSQRLPVSSAQPIASYGCPCLFQRSGKPQNGSGMCWSAKFCFVGKFDSGCIPCTPSAHANALTPAPWGSPDDIELTMLDLRSLQFPVGLTDSTTGSGLCRHSAFSILTLSNRWQSFTERTVPITTSQKAFLCFSRQHYPSLSRDY
jgi:hypothetical protein